MSLVTASIRSLADRSNTSQMKGSKMFKGLVKLRAIIASVFIAVFVSIVVAVPALAVESEGAKKVKEVTTQVSTEGVEILLAVLGGLVALIALTIVLPKGISFIRRFI